MVVTQKEIAVMKLIREAETFQPSSSARCDGDTADVVAIIVGSDYVTRLIEDKAWLFFAEL